MACAVWGPLQLSPLLSPSRYYITRAKLVSKIAKYPHVVSKGLWPRVEVVGQGGMPSWEELRGTVSPRGLAFSLPFVRRTIGAP